MKLSLTLTALLATLDSASGRVAATEKIMKNARRLDYNYHYANGGYSAGYAYEEGKEGAFLQGYSLKMMSCLKGEKSYNYQEKTTEFNTVIFRLCPVDTCSNSTSTPCDEGFGDFAVGLNTFAEAYVESIKDNYNNGYNNGMTYYSYDYGEINMEEYVRECKLWEEEGQDNENYDAYGTYAYIGATCTDDGTDIKLASFSDPYCTEESEDSFADTHNGFELPYSSGGLAPDDCVSCMSMNDNYEYELNEMCHQLYEGATYKCEENMEAYNYYYGPDTRGCDYLYDYVPKASRKKKSSSSNNKSSSASSGNFFTNQSEEAKMAEELVAVLIISAIIGAVVVAAFTQDRISKLKEPSDEESEEAPSKVESVVESMRSGAMLVKISALGLAATIAAKLRPAPEPEPEPEGEYMEMDKTKKGPEKYDEC